VGLSNSAYLRAAAGAMNVSGSSITLVSGAYLQADSGSITLTANASNPSGTISLTGTGTHISTPNTLTTVSHGGTIIGGTNNTISSFNATNNGSGDIQLALIVGQVVSSNNSASTLSIAGISQSGGGNVLIDTTGALAITGAVNTGAGNATFVSTGAMTQSGLGIITTNVLHADTRNDSGAAITLNLANNASSVVLQALSALGNEVNPYRAGAISYVDADGFSITGVGTTSTISLTSNTGAITQTGAILGTTLTTSSATGTTFTNSGNAVTGFNATNSTSGNISLTNTATTLSLTGISEAGGGNTTINNR
jgi:hypothetical protein